MWSKGCASSAPCYPFAFQHLDNAIALHEIVPLTLGTTSSGGTEICEKSHKLLYVIINISLH